MPTPAVLLLATPIFGLSLSISPELATPSFVRGTLAFDVAGSAVVAAAEEGEAPEEDAAALMAKRARIARVHRALGISTWAAMTWTAPEAERDGQCRLGAIRTAARSSQASHFSNHPTPSRSHHQYPPHGGLLCGICLRRSTLMGRGTPVASNAPWRVASRAAAPH
jgi:hypothetical protein